MVFPASSAVSPPTRTAPTSGTAMSPFSSTRKRPERSGLSYTPTSIRSPEPILSGGGEVDGAFPDCWACPAFACTQKNAEITAANTSVFAISLTLFLIFVSVGDIRAATRISISLSIVVAVHAVAIGVEVLKPHVHIVHHHAGDGRIDPPQQIARADQSALASSPPWELKN